MKRKQFLLGVHIIGIIIVVVVGLVVGLVVINVVLADVVVVWHWLPLLTVIVLSNPPLHSYVNQSKNSLSDAPGHSFWRHDGHDTNPPCHTLTSHSSWPLHPCWIYSNWALFGVDLFRQEYRANETLKNGELFNWIRWNDSYWRHPPSHLSLTVLPQKISIFLALDGLLHWLAGLGELLSFTTATGAGQGFPAPGGLAPTPYMSTPPMILELSIPSEQM